MRKKQYRYLMVFADYKIIYDTASNKKEMLESWGCLTACHGKIILFERMKAINPSNANVE